MKTTVGSPPNFELIAEAFPAVRRRATDIFFAYSPHVYNIRGAALPRELWEHEALHIQRQGSAPGLWWEKYLADIDFRAVEELVAHVAEYHTRVALEGDTRPARRRALKIVASRLASPIYGPMFNKRDAMVALRERI